MKAKKADRHAHAPAGSEHRVTLCGNGGCSCGCPQIHTNSNGSKVFLTDDYKGIAFLTKAEFKMLVEQAKAGKLDSLIQ